MGFWQDAGGEIWGAISSPFQTVSQAAQNVWNSIGFNVGYLSGDPTATAQVQQDTNAQQQAQQDWLNANPDSTPEDYSHWIYDNFPNTFSNYVDQGNTGSANNAVSNFSISNQTAQGILGVGILIVIISLFRR